MAHHRVRLPVCARHGHIPLHDFPRARCNCNYLGRTSAGTQPVLFPPRASCRALSICSWCSSGLLVHLRLGLLAAGNQPAERNAQTLFCAGRYSRVFGRRHRKAAEPAARPRAQHIASAVELYRNQKFTGGPAGSAIRQRSRLFPRRIRFRIDNGICRSNRTSKLGFSSAHANGMCRPGIIVPLCSWRVSFARQREKWSRW